MKKVLLALFLVTPFALGAQTADSIKKSQGDAVVVEAERPFSAASDAEFRAVDFQLRPKNSAQDILRVVPGLFIAQHAGGGKAEQIFLRGFDCDHGTDINISVDDAPVNMISHGHGQGYADLHFIIPEAIERVDVAKGPYFARFGDLATAGAVVFNTYEKLNENIVRLEGGQFGTYRALGLVKAPFESEKIHSYFGAEVYKTDGYFEREQNFNRINLMGKATFMTGETSRISASLLTFSGGWDASGQVPERAVESGLITRFGSIDPNEGGTTSRTTGIVKFTTGGFNPFTITGSLTDYRFRLYSNFTFFLDDSVNGDMIEQTDKRTIASLRAETNQHYQVGNSIMQTTFGANFRSDDIAVGLYHDSARTRIEARREGLVNQRQLGSYIQQEMSYDIINLQLGLRADYIGFDVTNLLEESASAEGVAQQFILSPKANLSVTPTDGLSFFGNFGYGFHSNDARVVVAAKGADSTLPRAMGFETGVRIGKVSDVISGSVAAWQLDLASELVYIGDAGDYEPKGRTRRQGIDLELRVAPLEWLAIGADMTLSRGRFLDLAQGENFIPLAPNMTLTANAVAKFDGFSTALRLRMLDDRPANETNTVTALGYEVVDLSAAYRITANIELYANIENLFDAVWNEAQFDTESRLKGEAESVSELHYTPGSPRSVRVGMAYKF
jgi:outer membrane receptor protein involved in Fe transport